VRHRRHKAGHDTIASRPASDGRRDPKRAGWFVGGVAVGVLLLVMWLVVSPYFFRSGLADHTDHTDLGGGLPSGTPSSQHQSSQDQMQRCVDAALAMKPALDRAAASVAQWQTHVEAMNQLVRGAITLGQATAFWNRTRMGALHRASRFEEAWTRVQRDGVDCPRPSRLPSQSVQELRTCAEQVHADMQVLGAARTAIGTWLSHVRAMNMLRMGTLSASRATQMWLAMWHRGQHEIDMYRAAVRVSREVPGPGCPSSAA
jgi:hypothetical protein